MILAGGREVDAPVRDISKGGIAVILDANVELGAECGFRLPGSNELSYGRVARIGPGFVAFAFRQDPATLRRVDAALDRIGAASRDRAA